MFYISSSVTALRHTIKTIIFYSFSVICQGMKCCLYGMVKLWLPKCLKMFIYNWPPFLPCWDFFFVTYCEMLLHIIVTQAERLPSHSVDFSHKWYLTVQLKLPVFCVLILEEDSEQVWDKANVAFVDIKWLSKKLPRMLVDLQDF